jgi:hypothetical protein
MVWLVVGVVLFPVALPVLLERETESAPDGTSCWMSGFCSFPVGSGPGPPVHAARAERHPQTTPEAKPRGTFSLSGERSEPETIAILALAMKPPSAGLPAVGIIPLDETAAQ